VDKEHSNEGLGSEKNLLSEVKDAKARGRKKDKKKGHLGKENHRK